MYKLKVIGKNKIWLTISSLLVIASIISLSIFGLNLGIDFTGGSMMNIEFKDITKPNIDEVREIINSLEIEQIKIQPIGENGYIIRMPAISEEKHQEILSALNKKFTPPKEVNEDEKNIENKNIEIAGDNIEDVKIETKVINPHTSEKVVGINQDIKMVEEKKFDAIGPVIGQELKEKSLWAILIVLIAIVLYIAYTFRKVSKPVESWKYGLSAIIALFHDVIIILGIFSVLGYTLNIEIDSFFITALLTILGYSVNDTIVTFDRIRENLHKRTDLTFKDLLNLSINETITRSLNTSFTTLIVLASVFIFGGDSIRFFILALILGVIFGTYSSIFVASPALMFWYRLKYKR